MYVARINDRGKASYTYMFDDQLLELNDLFTKSYYMKKSSNLHDIVEFCADWNEKHKKNIEENSKLYYLNILLKGLLQAPALVVLYTCIVMGALIIFGSVFFHEQVVLTGVAAFGGIVSKIVIAVYVISAGIGLLASLSKYDNVQYKVMRSIFSIITFIIICPLFFNRIFFSGSNVAILLTIVVIVGCFFIRFFADHLLTSIIRSHTEKMIREWHGSEGRSMDASGHYSTARAAVTGASAEISRHAAEASDSVVSNFKPQTIMDRLRNKEIVKQYSRSRV